MHNMKFGNLFTLNKVYGRPEFGVNNFNGNECTVGTFLLFHEFLQKNPRFRDSDIIGGYEQFDDVNPFPSSYSNIEEDEIWKVRLGSKSYAIAINRPWKCDYRARDRMVFCRHYEKDEVPIRRTKNRVKVYDISVNTSNGKSQYSNDCQIRTIAAVTESDYFEVHNEMSKRGWSERNTGNLTTKGFKKSRWEEVLDVFGVKLNLIWSKDAFKLQTTPKELKSKRGMTIATSVKHLKEGKYIIDVSGHVCAVIDGKLFDGWDSSGTRVINIYEVIKN